MYVVRTSARAFVAAIVPLAIFHGVIIAMGLLGYLAQSNTSPVGFPTPDEALSLFLVRVFLDGALFLAGHYEARRALFTSRAAYALIGGCAASVGYAVVTVFGLSLGVRPTGTLLTAGILPVFFGLLSGFLYNQFAGLEQIDLGIEAQSTADPVPPAPRYQGPIQVRTSIAGVTIAALIPAAFTLIIAFPLLLTTVPILDRDEPASGLWTHGVVALGLPAQIFISTLLVSALPAGLSALAIHGVARAIGCTRMRDYAACGMVVGLAASLMFSPLNPFTALYFLVVPSIFIGAMMGIAYRRFAGVEPLPLPEAVLVGDVEAVVPEDHPDRSTHRIVLNG